ncbi:MAG TPA: hypothetical protein VIX59_04040 [Candidatus Binataceae bacterium]
MSGFQTAALLAGLSLISAGCFHTAGPLPGNFYHPEPDSPRRLGASVALLDAPPSGFQWYGCGTSEDSCTVILQPALSAAVESVLKNNFLTVESSPDLYSAERDADLVAMEDITTTPSYGVLDGYIRVTLTFKDSRSGQVLSDVTSVAKIHLRPAMLTAKNAALVIVDFATMDLFLPMHGYISNQDALAELTETVQPPLAASIQDLSRQIADNALLVSFASSHVPRHPHERIEVEQVEERR